MLFLKESKITWKNYPLLKKSFPETTINGVIDSWPESELLQSKTIERTIQLWKFFRVFKRLLCIYSHMMHH